MMQEKNTAPQGRIIRVFRCANATLCFVMVIGVLAAVIYSFRSGKLQGELAQTAAVVAALSTIVWGGYYATLRVEINGSGIICRRWLFVRNFYSWENFIHADLEEIDQGEVASCTIFFHFKGGEKCTVSSRFFLLEEVRELRDEMRAEGTLG